MDCMYLQPGWLRISYPFHERDLFWCPHASHDGLETFVRCEIGRLSFICFVPNVEYWEQIIGRYG